MEEHNTKYDMKMKSENNYDHLYAKTAISFKDYK